MKQFIEQLTERDFQKKKLAFVENGTWAPVAAKIMKAAFEKSKNMEYAETTVTIRSAVTEENREQLAELAKEMK